MKLFISYRRKGNVQRAMNLASVLRENFGKDNVFLDTGDIEIGQSFPEVISGKLRQVDALIALIGPEWLSSVDENFRRRIDSPEDWVHIEIATALSRSITIIPIYAGDANKLKPEQLPEPLKPLANLQSYDLRDDHHWNDDVVALVSRLKGRDILPNEICWPKNVPQYVPDAVGPVKIQQLTASLPGWELREYEIEDGPYKGKRGNELKRVFHFKRFVDAVNFMLETRDVINAIQHHPRWENVFRDVVVRLSSWDVGHKVTDRDFILAKYMSRIFAAYERKNKDDQAKGHSSQ